MPEDIMYEPSTHSAGRIVDTHSLKSSQEITQPVDIHWNEMQGKINQFVAELKTKYHNLPEYQLELIGDLYGGPFRLEHPPGVDLNRDQDEEKEISARIQHNQAHAMFYAAFGPSDEGYQREVRNRVELFNKISSSDPGRDVGVPSFWNGVRAEATILSELHNRGYRVFLPNYSEDPYEIPWENNEVLQWDIKSGVDMVGEKNGKVYLIDAKGERYLRDKELGRGERIGGSVYVSESYKTDSGPRMNRLPPSLRHFIAALAPDDIRRATIIIPTSNSAYVENSEPATDREYLQKFITLKSSISGDIFK